MNSPSSTKLLKDATAPPFLVEVGRIVILPAPACRGGIYSRSIVTKAAGPSPRRADPLQLPHSVFKKVISASLSLGPSSLKSSAASCASPS
jgi:hypothetical protein